MRTSENFLKSLPIVAAQLGDKLGVKVAFANAACTDGKHIFLPLTFNDERPLSREEILGFLVHEASHVRFTSFNAHKAIAHLPSIAQNLLNAIEDARIEQLICAQYAGASYLLNEAHKPVHEKVLAPDFTTDAQTAFMLYPLYACETTYNAFLAPCRDVYRNLCVNYFGEDIMSKVDVELQAYPQLKNTRDVAELVDRIMAILLDALGDFEDQQDEDQSQMPSESQSESQDGDQNGQGSSNGQNASSDQRQMTQASNDASGKSDGSNGSENSELRDEEKAGNAGTSGSGQKSQDSSSDSESGNGSADGKKGSDKAKSEASDDASNGSGSSGEDASSDSDSESQSGSSADSGSSSNDSGDASGGDTSDKDSSNQNSKGHSSGCGFSKIPSSVGKELARTLEASVRVDESLIPAEALKEKINASSEDNEIFEHGYRATPPKSCQEIRHRTPTDDERTLGLDRLNAAKKQSLQARRALMNIVQAKARTGCYVANSGRRISARCLHRLSAGDTRIFEKRDEVIGINTSVSLLLDLSGSVDAFDETVIEAGLALVEALRGIQGVKTQMAVFPSDACRAVPSDEYGMGMRIIVPFGHDPRKYLGEIGSLENWGGTPLTESLIQTTLQLSRRPESRHIVIVVTDGMVEPSAQYVVKKLLKSDVTVVGIGVGNCVRADSFEAIFPIWEVLPFDGLQQALMKISKRLMLEGFKPR